MSEHVGLSPLQIDLLKKGEIHIEGEIDDTLAAYVHECMIHLSVNDNPDVDIYIQSTGGSYTSSLQIFDEIRLYKGKTRGVVPAYAHSGAAIILQACTLRVAARHAEILIHDAAMEVSLCEADVLPTSNTPAIILRSLVSSRRVMDGILVRRTGRTLREIRTQCELNKPMTAREAKKFGLLDKLI